MKFNSSKERLLTFILFFYIGGFSFYVGVGSKLTIVPIICPLITYFIGYYVFENLIMKYTVENKMEKKIFRILMTVAYCMICITAILGIGSYAHNNINKAIILEPFGFGLLYGLFYWGFIKIIYRNK